MDGFVREAVRRPLSRRQPLIEHDIPGLQQEMWARHGEYLTALKADEYRRKVFDYTAYEDSPRLAAFQLRLLEKAGFIADVVHKHGCFAALCAARL